jgi:hypothetical protein
MLMILSVISSGLIGVVPSIPSRSTFYVGDLVRDSVGNDWGGTIDSVRIDFGGCIDSVRINFGHFIDFVGIDFGGCIDSVWIDVGGSIDCVCGSIDFVGIDFGSIDSIRSMVDAICTFRESVWISFGGTIDSVNVGRSIAFSMGKRI